MAVRYNTPTATFQGLCNAGHCRVAGARCNNSAVLMFNNVRLTCHSAYRHPNENFIY
jgi:hypothetical protein